MNSRGPSKIVYIKREFTRVAQVLCVSLHRLRMYAKHYNKTTNKQCIKS